MNKLTRVFFVSRPINGDAILPGRVDAHIPMRTRTKPALIAVWAPDPETGRLICTWRRPAEESSSATLATGEPPPAFQTAA